MTAVNPDRLPVNRSLLANAINESRDAAFYPGLLTPKWRIRIKGNATAPASGTCILADGTQLTYVNSNAPTSAQFGVTYNATAGAFNVFDGSTGGQLGFGNITGIRVVFTPNTAQGLIPSLASISGTNIRVTLLTGAAGATATDPTSTAWTLDIEGYNNM